MQRIHVPKARPTNLNEVDLASIISLKEAAALSNLSPTSWRLNRADQLIRLSPGRVGVRLCDALMLDTPKELKKAVEKIKGSAADLSKARKSARKVAAMRAG